MYVKRKKIEQHKIPSHINFIIAGFAKIIATLITYPYILTKVCMQNSGSSFWNVVRDIYKTDGFFAFFRGLQIQLIKAVLTSAFRSMAVGKILQLFKLIK